MCGLESIFKKTLFIIILNIFSETKATVSDSSCATDSRQLKGTQFMKKKREKKRVAGKSTFYFFAL